MKVSRRDFVHAGCVAVAVSFVPPFLDVAKARSIHGNGGHNSGRSQVNLDYLTYGGEYPFTNHVKTAPSWSALNGADICIPPDTLDSDNYPTSIVGGTGGVVTLFNVPPQSALAGTYTCAWDGGQNGVGTIYCPNAASITGSKTSGASGGSFTFTPSVTGITLGISAIGSSKITNLRFYYTSDGDPSSTGLVFNSRFKAKIAVLRPAVLRFLNWLVNNNDQISTWWTRRATTCFTYGGTEYRPSLYCGTSSTTSATYTASAPAFSSAIGAAWDGVLRDKTTVLVKFNKSSITSITTASAGATTVLTIPTGSGAPDFHNGDAVIIRGVTGGTWTGLNGATTVSAASSGSVTVNVNSSGFTGSPDCSDAQIYFTRATFDVGGTGAKNIISEFCAPLSGFSSIVGNSYASLSALVYNLALDAWIKTGADQATGSQGLNNGAPPELMLQLCIEVGAHPYYTVSALALDAIPTDYTACLVAYNKANAPSWMKPRYEGPNELWNYSTSTSATITWYAAKMQSIINGAKSPGGVWANTDYSVSNLTYPGSGGAGTSDVTFSTTGNAFIKGSRVTLSTFAGAFAALNGLQPYVTAINVGGNPNKVTINTAPATGSYTSGGLATGVIDDQDNWYGTAISKMGQIVSTGYSGDTSKYETICGVKTGTMGTSGERAAAAPRLASTSYVLQNNPPAGLTAAAASTVITCGACAQYYGPSSDGSAETIAYAGCTFEGSISGTTLTITSGSINGTVAIGKTIQGIGANGAAVAASTTITGGSGLSWTINNSQTVALMPMVGGADLTAPVTYEATVNSGGGAFTLTACALLYAGCKTYFQTFSVNKMCGYEGGYSPDFTSAGNSGFDRMVAASKLASALSAHNTTTFNDFIGLTGGGFTAEFPSNYLFSANPYTLGFGYVNVVWSIADDIYQSPTSPQWQSVVAFNH